MQKTILISIIGHILIFLIFAIVNFVQPRYTRLVRRKVTRVKFYNLKPKPKIKKTAARPQKKMSVKPKPTSKPKRTVKKEQPKKTRNQPPKKKPRPAQKPKPKPEPRRTPSPPLPRHDPAPPRAALEPVRSTPAPPSPPPRAPIKITHENLPSYYLVMATQKIESNFQLTRTHRYSGLVCSVEFRVNRQGLISGIRVAKSTGQPTLDRFAVEAVERTTALGPLPDSIRGSSITITANFDYSPD